ncbi:uncharacterized protein BO72DRAFT_344683, partial [Aspergillus fijiensis CBS 313.89]
CCKNIIECLPVIVVIACLLLVDGFKFPIAGVTAAGALVERIAYGCKVTNLVGGAMNIIKADSRATIPCLQF